MISRAAGTCLWVPAAVSYKEKTYSRNKKITEFSPSIAAFYLYLQKKLFAQKLGKIRLKIFFVYAKIMHEKFIHRFLRH